MWKITLILVGTTLAAGYVSAHLWQQLRTERERTEALQAQVTELEKMQSVRTPHPFAPPPLVEEAPAPVPVVEVPRRPAPAVEPKPPEPAVSDAPADPQPRIATFMAHRQNLMKDPEYREAMRAQQRMMLPQSYPDVAKALNMTQQEAEALFDLLADQQLKMMEMSANMVPGVPPDEAALSEMRRKSQEMQHTNEAEMTALLGSAKHQQWKEYQETLGARHQVNRLRSVLDSAGYPLTEDQTQPLIAAVAAEQRRQMSEMQVQMREAPALAVAMTPGISATGTAVLPPSALQQMEESLNRTAEANRRLRDRAASYLSPQQLERFEQMLEQDLNMRRINLRMQRAQMEAQGPGEPAGMIGLQSIGGP